MAEGLGNGLQRVDLLGKPMYAGSSPAPGSKFFYVLFGNLEEELWRRG